MTCASAIRRWAPPALALAVAGFLAVSLPPYLIGETRVPATFSCTIRSWSGT